jgi:hypothetical protein
MYWLVTSIGDYKHWGRFFLLLYGNLESTWHENMFQNHDFGSGNRPFEFN